MAGKPKFIFAGHEVGLVMIGSIRGLGHIVPKDQFILMTDDKSRQKKTCVYRAEESGGWAANQFNVNRFYVHHAVDKNENVAVY